MSRILEISHMLTVDIDHACHSLLCLFLHEHWNGDTPILVPNMVGEDKQIVNWC